MEVHPLPLVSSPGPTSASPPPLLDRLRSAAHARSDSLATAETLVSWARAFILFHEALVTL